MATARDRELTVAACVSREIADAAEWNRLLLALPRHDLRQAHEWGESRVRQGWQVRRIAVFRDGACVAAIAVMGRRLPVTGSILYAASGPLLHDLADGGAWDELLQAVRRVADESGALFLRVSPKAEDGEADVREALLARGFRHLPEDWTTWNDPRILMVLDLTGTEQEIKKRMSKRVAQYVGRAVKLGATVEHLSSAEAMEQFHALLVKMGRRKKIPTRELEAFEALRQLYLANGQGTLIVARHGGQTLGSVLVVRFGDRAHLLYAAQEVEAAEARAFHTGPTLYWEMMMWARAQGCTSLDLGGSATHYPPRGDEPGYGVYHFKQGCGATLRYMTGYYDLVFRPVLYQAFRVAERRLLPLAWDLRSRVNR